MLAREHAQHVTRLRDPRFGRSRFQQSPAIDRSERPRTIEGVSDHRGDVFTDGSRARVARGHAEWKDGDAVPVQRVGPCPSGAPSEDAGHHDGESTDRNQRRSAITRSSAPRAARHRERRLLDGRGRECSLEIVGVGESVRGHFRQRFPQQPLERWADGLPDGRDRRQLVDGVARQHRLRSGAGKRRRADEHLVQHAPE